MKISFDFDSTLSERRIQKLATKFINDGHDVWITTSRRKDPPDNIGWDNVTVFKVAERLGIPTEKIQFTDGKDKFPHLTDFDIHFDDDQIEIELIEENLETCIGVLILDP